MLQDLISGHPARQPFAFRGDVTETETGTAVSDTGHDSAQLAEELKLVIADGFSCREQILQTSDCKPLHLAQVLRMALPPLAIPQEGEGAVIGHTLRVACTTTPMPAQIRLT